MNRKYSNYSSRKRYAQISLKKRQTLVQQVLVQKKSLSQVSKRLNIKLSTAKLILKKYKQTGQLLDKWMRNFKKTQEKDPKESVQHQQIEYNSNPSKVDGNVQSLDKVSNQAVIEFSPFFLTPLVHYGFDSPYFYWNLQNQFCWS